jgi:hypothetical protein
MSDPFRALATQTAEGLGSVCKLGLCHSSEAHLYFLTVGAWEYSYGVNIAKSLILSKRQKMEWRLLHDCLCTLRESASIFL